MRVSMRNFKQNITKLPAYNDGVLELFAIKQTNDTYPIDYLSSTGKKIYFEELSISDRLRFEAEQRQKDLSLKIRIPQTKEIDSLCVLKIGDNYHKVYNAYHFTNNEGFKQTDLTLENYNNPKLEEDL